MRKRLFTILLTAMMFVLLFLAGANAADVVANGDCGAEGDSVTWTLDSDGKLSITGSGAMTDYNFSSLVPWNSYRSSVKTVTIANGVTTIGKDAFFSCESLTNVTIGNSVTTIGDGAFQWCENLTSVTIPNSVTSIGDEAFYYCSSLTSVTIPNSVTSIGAGAFYYCTSLTELVVDEKNAYYCSEDGVLFNKAKTTLLCYPGGKVGAYTIPDSVTSIGNYAFLGCSSLTSVTIPDSVTSIGDDAFWGCDSLTSVTIPNSVTSIGDEAFRGCGSLTSVDIPDSVTSIGESAFKLCYSMTSVNIGNSVTSIGDYAFLNCESLANVSIGNSVTSIGEGAFGYCWSLTTVTIPDSVTSIGDYAFASCNNLASVNIPDSVTSIGEGTFYVCSSLASVNIPDSVTSIGDFAFSFCESLTSVSIGNSTISIGAYAFSYCSSLTSVTIPDSVTSIGKDAFYGCSSLTSVTISDSVTSIGGYAFFDCTNLKSISIPESVTEIGEFVFGFYYDENIEATGILDSFTAIVTKGSAAETYCIANGINYTYNVTQDICVNHDMVTDAAIAATCTETGLTEGSHCSRCDYKIAQETIPALGHSFTNYIYNGDAQIGKDGTETATCDRCDATDTRTKIGSALADPNPDNPFVDVAPGKFYYQPVLWAVENGITNGLTATTFAPNETCTRGQVVTFLWRAAGKPEPKSNNNPFTDVIAGKYYYKAVLWAVENNITSGMTKTTFEPNSPCTRSQVVTFQWRAAGKPEPKSTNNPFTDVPAGKFYSKAVLWAVENGITSGMTKTTFVPDNVCTRGQIVTFLYRQYS